MLSVKAKKVLTVALANKAVGAEIAAAIDSGSNPQAAAVAVFGATTNLSALVVTPTALTPAVVAATTFAATVGTYALPAEPTGAEVDATVDAALAQVKAVVDIKADNADLETMRGEVETALDDKADNADVETLRTETEGRLDAIESKINAVITALKGAGLMLP